MLVSDHTVMNKIAVLVAGTDDRDLFFKINKRFEYGVVAIEIRERCFYIICGLYFALPFTIVAKTGGF